MDDCEIEVGNKRECAVENELKHTYLAGHLYAELR